jgi:hypothetical protein
VEKVEKEKLLEPANCAKLSFLPLPSPALIHPGGFGIWFENTSVSLHPSPGGSLSLTGEDHDRPLVPGLSKKGAGGFFKA